MFGTVTSALNHVAAETVLALRRESDVGHDGDAGIDDLFDLWCAPDAALKLHSLTASLFHEANRGLEGLSPAVLVRAEWHVSDDQGPTRAPDHGSGQRNQLVQRDGNGGVVPEDGVAC